MSETGTGARPRHASTCLLIRPADKGPEVFLTRRLESMRFVGGYHVFPGGKVETEDMSGDAWSLVTGRTEDELRQWMGDGCEPALARGHVLAAVRELFEESGILLALTASGASVHTAPSGLEEWRRQLMAGEADFYGDLRKRGWRLDLAAIDYFDHWVTPNYVPIRFDTRFFSVRMPEGATATHWPGEADDGIWLTPSEAIACWERQEIRMIPPTLFSLRRLIDGA